MTSNPRSQSRVFIGFLARTTILHVLTYIIVGAISYRFIARYLWEGPVILPGMRDIQSPAVQMMILPAQILRGLLIASAIYPVRQFLLANRRSGGLIIASILLLIGSFAGISGQIEVWVYTTGFNMRLFLAHLPEIIIQSILFGYLILAWERRIDSKKPTPASA